MARLPKPGGDNGTWGDVLNDYLSQVHKSDGTLKDNAVTPNVLAPNSVTNAAIASNAVNAASIADGSITETLLDTGVRTKLNSAGGPPDWATITNKPAVIAAGTDQLSARAAISLGNVDNTSDANKPISTATQSALNGKAPLASPTFTGAVTVPTPTNGTDAATKAYVDGVGTTSAAVLGSDPISWASKAAALRAHIWVDVNAGIYQRDGIGVSAASVLTHNTTGSKPYFELNPSTSNDIHATSGGSTGKVGSGGSLPTGWTLINPSSASVSVERVSGDGSFDVELLVTLPPASYVGYSSPDISVANNTRHINFNLTAAATDLEYIQTTVGWVIGTPNAQINSSGGGGQITLEIAGSSASTDKMQWLFTNLNTTASITVRILVKNVAVYVPAVSGGLRRNVQPVVFDTGTLNARDATISVAAGDYVVFAWTEARGAVGQRVTVGGTSFSLQTVIGNGRVSKVAVWKLADYVDGYADVIDPPAWETVDEFDTWHLEQMSDQITSAAKMRYQAPGNPWNVQVAVNRFGRSMIESRPGEYMVIDAIAPITYAHAYQRRAEVLSNRSYPYSTDIWTSFAFKTDAMLSDPNGYGIIWQWLDTAAAGDLIALGPSLSLQLRQNGQLGLFTASTSDPNPSTMPAVALRWLGRFNVGQWNRVVMRTQFSQSGGGKLGFWLNGVEQYAFQDTPVGYNKPSGVQPHYGFYGGQSNSTIIIDRANVEFGTQDLSSRITNPLPV